MTAKQRRLRKQRWMQQARREGLTYRAFMLRRTHRRYVRALDGFSEALGELFGRHEPFMFRVLGGKP